MIYMDNCATSPVKEEVFNAMLPYLKEEFGNPSTYYDLGRNAKRGIEEARDNVADLVNAFSNEIIFTSGGTESDNMAIKGVALKHQDNGKHIITTMIEHPAVRNTCRYLEEKGFEVTYLPVQSNGIIDVNDLNDAIRADTILISVMHANNEYGTIQPIGRIGKIAKEHDIIFHCDAVQSLGKIPVDVKEMNVDLLSVASHKIYGPKGVGALFIRRGVEIEPLIHGGGQEYDVRAGTENVPGIVGFGKAAQIARENLNNEMKYLTRIRDRLIERILDTIPESYLNGDKNHRLPNNVNIRFNGIRSESIVLRLNAEGISCAAGSACSSKSKHPPYAMLALGLSEEEVQSAIRLSIGTENKLDEVDDVVEALEDNIAMFREMSPMWDNENNKSISLKK